MGGPPRGGGARGGGGGGGGRGRGGVAGRCHLVLQAAVLPLGVLTHDEDVDVAVPRLHPREALAVDDVGVEVQAGPAPPPPDTPR